MKVKGNLRVEEDTQAVEVVCSQSLLVRLAQGKSRRQLTNTAEDRANLCPVLGKPNGKPITKHMVCISVDLTLGHAVAQVQSPKPTLNSTSACQLVTDSGILLHSQPV